MTDGTVHDLDRRQRSFKTFPKLDGVLVSKPIIQNTLPCIYCLSFLSIDWSRDILAVALNKRGKHHVNCHNMTQHSPVSVVSPGCRGDPGARLSILEWELRRCEEWGPGRGLAAETRPVSVRCLARGEEVSTISITTYFWLGHNLPDSWFIQRV